ncbi:hypothetical protein [Nocardia shimofusensis]|uniref:hypothetical protein n=1 Tax=Nocardia shimofusensis TaxID=228596 RepID=UPI0008327F40|nr:hypothetical protein [Nocardia shimofusensis]
MTTPNTAPRPGVPLPGQHLPGTHGQPEPADPDRIRAEIDELLAELDAGGGHSGPPESAEAGVDITRRARILEQAHDVLVQALATVDKI